MPPLRSWIDRGTGVVRDSAWALTRLATSLAGRSPNVEFSTGDREPVLLLPGVYETWEFLRPVARRLHGLGHPIHAVPGFGHNIRPIPEMATMAAKYLEVNDLRDVTLVAHSKGGLIGKHLMVVDDRKGRISRMIAVNAPFAGSNYSRLAPNTTLREFRPTHATLVMLSANAQSNSRITSIYSEWDPLIPGSSRLEGAANHPLPVVGHFRLLADERLLALVETVVEQRPFPEHTPGVN